eukprot:gene22895-biopygen17769
MGPAGAYGTTSPRPGSPARRRRGGTVPPPLSEGSRSCVSVSCGGVAPSAVAVAPSAVAATFDGSEEDSGGSTGAFEAWTAARGLPGENDRGRVQDASHTIDFEGTDASRTRPQPGEPPGPAQGETAEDAPGTRPGRIRFFKLYRVGRVRDASGTRPRPFLPGRSSGTH